MEHLDDWFRIGCGIISMIGGVLVTPLLFWLFPTHKVLTTVVGIAIALFSYFLLLRTARGTLH